MPENVFAGDVYEWWNLLSRISVKAIWKYKELSDSSFVIPQYIFEARSPLTSDPYFHLVSWCLSLCVLFLKKLCNCFWQFSCIYVCGFYQGTPISSSSSWFALMNCFFRRWHLRRHHFFYKELIGMGPRWLICYWVLEELFHSSLLESCLSRVTKWSESSKMILCALSTASWLNLETRWKS